MRTILAILLLLPAACSGSDKGEQAAAGEAGDPAALAGLDLPAGGAADPARLRALIDRGITQALPGGRSARYRNVRGGVGGAACGEVALNSNQFRPFAVTPDGVAVVAASPTIAFDDPSDIAADAWIRWCATPEELQALTPRLEQATQTPLEDPVNVSAASEAPLSPIANTGAAPVAAAEPPPPPSRKAPPPEIDSFFNSVQR